MGSESPIVDERKTARARRKGSFTGSLFVLTRSVSEPLFTPRTQPQKLLSLLSAGGIKSLHAGTDKRTLGRTLRQAANEQDSDKLLELVKEINRLLAEQQDRLSNKKPHPEE